MRILSLSTEGLKAKITEELQRNILITVSPRQEVQSNDLNNFHCQSKSNREYELLTSSVTSCAFETLDLRLNHVSEIMKRSFDFAVEALKNTVVLLFSIQHIRSISGLLSNVEGLNEYLSMLLLSFCHAFINITNT